jgi:multidrug efflux pump subunit AcrB
MTSTKPVVFTVQLQAEGEFRSKPDDIGNMYVRSATTGQMVRHVRSPRSSL